VKVHEPFKGDEKYDVSNRSLYFNFQCVVLDTIRFYLKIGTFPLDKTLLSRYADFDKNEIECYALNSNLVQCKRVPDIFHWSCEEKMLG
jgi:hypothetical protein